METIITLFLMFFKIGFTAFGGGYGMMSMIMQEGQRLVGLTEAEFADMAALDLICSGPVAINAATYVGYIKAGFWGALAASIGCVLPPVIIGIVVLIFLDRFYESTLISGLFAGITPACAGLLFFTTLTLSKSVYFDAETFSEILSKPLPTTVIGMLLLTAATIVADLKFKMNPVFLTLAGAVLGILFLS